MLMKISNREKGLLIILSVIIIIGCYYKFVYIKQDNTVKQLEAEKNQYEQKLTSMRIYTASINKQQSDIKILNAKIEDKTLELFPDITEEKIIVDLDNMLSTSSLEGGSITFSDAALESEEQQKQADKKDMPNLLQDLVDQYNGVETSNSNNSNNSKLNNSNSVNNKNKNVASAEKMTATIKFKGSYANVMDFIKSVESYSKKIIVSNIKLAQDATGGVGGTITLDFYAVPKITDEDKDFFKWDYKNQYGKANPFDGTSTIAPAETNTAQQTKFDFYMTVKPISSALPTIMLEKNKYATNSNEETCVYADNPGVESVEIYFSEQDGNYYYKYRTSGDSFPKQFNGNGDEFSPLGDTINLEIYSNKRNSSTDTSGANVKVYNNTDKTVNVLVNGDDADRPRVSILKSGNVSVQTN